MTIDSSIHLELLKGTGYFYLGSLALHFREVARQEKVACPLLRGKGKKEKVSE
jgi:hypothetical protein